MIINNGSEKNVLNIKVDIGGVQKLVREIKVDIDGVQKTTDYSPIDLVTFPSSTVGTPIKFYYGPSWVSTPPIILNTIVNNAFKVRIGYGIYEGATAINREWKLLTSSVEVGEEGTFTDTGLRVTPTAEGAHYYYVESVISPVSIKRVVWVPVAWFSGSFSPSTDVAKIYYNL